MSNSTRFLFLAGVLVAAAVACSSADAYTWHARNVPPSYLPASGHYYQIWDAQIAEGEYFSWVDAAQFASSLSYQGEVGYAATIATEAEAQMLQDYNEMRSYGLTGALLVNGAWTWMTGPEAGHPVVFLRSPVYAVSQCAAYAQTITCSGGNWYMTPASGVFAPGGGPPNSCIIPSVMVEVGGLGATPARPSTWGGLKTIYR